MTIVQFFRILIARRAIFLVALVSCFMGAFLVSQVMLAPRYEARSRILLKALNPDPVTGEMIADGSVESYVSTQAELVTDYQTMGAVIDRLGWANNPTLIDQYAALTGGASPDIRRWLAQNIAASTSVQLIPGSNILEIVCSGNSPDAAKEISNLIRGTFIDLNVEQKRQAALRLADWYREQGDDALVALRELERQRADYARENGIALAQNAPDAEASKLSALAMQSMMVALPAPRSPASLASPAAMQLETVRQQLAQASTTLGPNHPAYQALQRQYSVLQGEAQREQAARSAAASSGGRPDLTAALERQKARVLAQKDQVDALDRMRRAAELKRDEYLKAMQRAADLRDTASSTESDLEPMGDPIGPEKPTFPNIPLITLGSIALGAVLGIVVAVLVELLALRIRGREDLDFAAGAPLLASLDGRRGLQRWLGLRRGSSGFSGHGFNEVAGVSR